MASPKSVPWCGAVTHAGATVSVLADRNINPPALTLDNATTTQRSEHQPTGVFTLSETQILTYQIEGLDSFTAYLYRIGLQTPVGGRFSTFPLPGSRQSIRFGFAACSNKRPEDVLTSVYSAIADEDLLFFCHGGDLHYRNLKDELTEPRILALAESIALPGVQLLFESCSVPYVWDDHDFLGNNVRGGDKPVPAGHALASYQRFVPHYPLDEDHGIYQSFAIGSVLVILTDNRSHQSKRPRSMLGSRQLQWLRERLIEGKQKDLIIWVNPLPWIAKTKWFGLIKPGWSGYKGERQEIAQFVKDNEINNLCMLSGDAHMLAIDDGTHSGYASKDADGRSGGFPIFQAASLDSKPSKKGGPYTIEPIEGIGQYGVIELDFTTDSPLVKWQGRKVGAEGFGNHRHDP